MGGTRLNVIRSHWSVGLALIGSYGFFMEMKPSEPYLTPYLVEDKHFTNDIVNNRIYPFWTYGQMCVLIFVPMMARLITPRRLFYLETLGFIMTRALLIWGQGLAEMRIMQLTYAVGTSAKTIYYSYAYLIFDRERFDFATGFLWGANALGVCISGVVGQALVNGGMSYLALNFISMGGVCVALVLAFFIPGEGYKNEEDCATTGIETTNIETEQTPLILTRGANSPTMIQGYIGGISGCARMVAADYVQVFKLFRDKRGPMALIWIMAKCVEGLVQNYSSNLWYGLKSDPEFYGAVTALYQGLGVIGALIPIFVKLIFECEEVQAAVVQRFQLTASLGLMASLMITTLTEELWIAYLAYIAFGLFYYIFITGVSCTLALDSQYFEQVGLFAANLFCASVLESIITLVLSNLDASPVTWFVMISILQGITIPIFFYKSHVLRGGLQSARETE